VRELPTRALRRVLPWLVGLALASTACTGEGVDSANGTTALPPTVRVHELDSISTLQESFNADAGAIRLILLVSPT